MRRASEILHKPVIVGSSGDCVGRVTNLVFDEQRGRCLAAVVDSGWLLRRTRVLSFADIVSIGTTFVAVRRRESLVRPRDMPGIAEYPHSVPVKGKLLIGTDGQSLGRIVDLRIDENSGRIEGYDLSRGRLMKLGSRAYLPVADGFVAGDDVVLAPAGAAERLRSGAPHNGSEELTSARA
jgi:uncharacterized protein YrrD